MSIAHLIQLYKGPLTIDLQGLEGVIDDIENDAVHSLRGEQDGFAEVVAELRESVPAHGAEADVSPDVYEHFQECNERIADIDERLAVLEKMVEVLKETRAKLDHERQTDLGVISSSVRKMAYQKNDQTIAAPFAKTIRYARQSAEKILNARRESQTIKPAAPAKRGCTPGCRRQRGFRAA